MARWNKLNKRYTYLALPIGALLLIAVLIYGVYYTPFDGATWRNPDSVSHRVRLRMVNDLVLKYNLRSMSKDEVLVLLGPPDDPSPSYPDRRQYPDWDLVYNLGIVDPFLMIGPGVMECLVIKCDDNNHVVDYKIGHGWRFR